MPERGGGLGELPLDWVPLTTSKQIQSLWKEIAPCKQVLVLTKLLNIGVIAVSDFGEE